MPASMRLPLPLTRLTARRCAPTPSTWLISAVNCLCHPLHSTTVVVRDLFPGLVQSGSPHCWTTLLCQLPVVPRFVPCRHRRCTTSMLALIIIRSWPPAPCSSRHDGRGTLSVSEVRCSLLLKQRAQSKQLSAPFRLFLGRLIPPPMWSLSTAI